MFDLTYKKFERIDILINNSAITIWKPFEHFTGVDWDRTIDTDLKSIFLCVKSALPSMKKIKVVLL
jgi:NAD(P)-dependent dehydrogenase (short-subunit alcohol dehydrogenase family)